MYGTYGIISLLPVLTLIVVALITKRTFESLLVATLLALIIGYKGDWFSALVEQLQTVAGGKYLGASGSWPAGRSGGRF